MRHCRNGNGHRHGGMEMSGNACIGRGWGVIIRPTPVILLPTHNTTSRLRLTWFCQHQFPQSNFSIAQHREPYILLAGIKDLWTNYWDSDVNPHKMCLKLFANWFFSDILNNYVYWYFHLLLCFHLYILSIWFHILRKAMIILHEIERAEQQKTERTRFVYFTFYFIRNVHALPSEVELLCVVRRGQKTPDSAQKLSHLLNWANASYWWANKWNIDLQISACMIKHPNRVAYLPAPQDLTLTACLAITEYFDE